MSATCPLCGGTIREALRWVSDTWEGERGYVAFTPAGAVAGAVSRDGRGRFTAHDERQKPMREHRTLRAAKLHVAHLAHNLAAMRADPIRHLRGEVSHDVVVCEALRFAAIMAELNPKQTLPPGAVDDIVKWAAAITSANKRCRDAQ